MRLNLLKAIKNTHRNPVSKILHVTGLSLYLIGFILIAGYYFNNLNFSSVIYGIVLFPIAVGLFLIGHKKEGNLRAMTIIVVMKYLKSKLRLRRDWELGAINRTNMVTNRNLYEFLPWCHCDYQAVSDLILLVLLYLHSTKVYSFNSVCVQRVSKMDA
jgi:hypothetical protein